MSLKDAIREAVDERAKQGSHLQEGHPQDEAQPESPEAANTASHKAVKPAGHTTTTPAMAETLRAERVRVGAPARKEQAPLVQVEVQAEETAAMTVRVSKRHRLHWLIAAKRQGTSLTAAVTEAMNARFGEPSEF